MKRACVAIIDASRARIYAYQHDVSDDPNDQLREVIDFANPVRRLRDSETHIESSDLDFAKRIVSEIDRVVHEFSFGHVIMVASPKMLGDLRRVDTVLRRADLILDEIPRDLAKLTSPQLHDHLARLKLISPRTRQTFAHRP